MSKPWRVVFADFLTHRYFYLILGLLILLMSLTLHSGKQGADGNEYLRWTHSFVFDQDIHLLNNVEAIGGSYRLTPTGYIFERVNIGAPLMWTPFYSAASFFLPPSADPASRFYPAVQLLWVNFSSWLYTILGGILTIAALRNLFTPRVLLTATIGVLLGTPVLFYMISFPLSAHPSSIFLASLLLYLWLSDKQNQPSLHYLTMGIIVGWLMAIANYNVALSLLPGFNLLQDYINEKRWQDFLRNGIAIGVGGIIGFAPQMIVWWFLFGGPLRTPYAGQIVWSEPYFLQTLFSNFHGVFFYAPVLLLVIPGLWWWRRKNPWAALSVGLSWLLFTYIISVSVGWWGGSSFGNRYFLTLTPFFVLGVSAFIQRGKKWAVALVLLCVLWTAGLYLQFLNGVRLTSDSVVFTVTEIIAGQIVALANIATILPYLVNIPWFSVPVMTLPVLIFILAIASRAVYGWVVVNGSRSRFYITRVVVTGCGIAVVLFIGWTGFKGEQTKAALASQGFYEKEHQVISYDIRETASDLVHRAAYHEQIGRLDRAIVDLNLASKIWKFDADQSPDRLYLGPKNTGVVNLPLTLHLDYPGHVRLIGYQILEANKEFIRGELFWEKLPVEKSRQVVTPLVRAFDQAGNKLGNIVIDFPFPAYYIPAGGLFKDNFYLEFNPSPESWVWLAVSVAEDLSLPVNRQGETESGIIASVNVETFPPPLLFSGEAPKRLVGQPRVLLNNNYQPGAMIPIQFVWQAPDDMVAGVLLALNLFDSTGKLAGQERYPIQNSVRDGLTETGRPPLPQSQNETYCFPIPATLPEGDYQLAFNLAPAAAGHLLDDNDEPVKDFSVPIRLSKADDISTITICRLIQADFPRRYEPTEPQYPIDILLTEQIKLAGYDLSIVPQSSSILASVILHWVAQDNGAHHYQVSVELLDATGQPVITHTTVPGHGMRATSTWLKGEWILDEHTLEIPVLAPGNYQLRLSLIDEQTGLPVQHRTGQTHLILQDMQIP